MADTVEKPASRYKRPVGAYVPPAKRVKAEKFDVGSDEYQRSLWDENKKKITGLINRASPSNLTAIVKELFKCNLIRYKGLFATALLKAQEKSPAFTDVYAALLCVINSRIKSIGKLVVNRLVLQYRIAFKNNNKPKLLVTVRFIAHLTNQDVVYDVLGFQLIEHLLYQPSQTLIEILIAFLKECGAKLEKTNAALFFETFKTLRSLSLENEFNARTHELIDQIHMIRKSKFRDYPPIKKELDLVDENDRITHEIALIEPPDGVTGVCPRKEDFQMELNYFKYDPNWSTNEAKYDEFRRSLLDEDEGDSSEDGSSDYEDVSSDDKEANDEEQEDKKPVIKKEQETPVVDKTGADLIAFRRSVYLTIKSSVRHEEVVHKLLKSKMVADSDLHEELCKMIVDCCGKDRTYEQIYGLVASRFCTLNRRNFAPIFEKLFAEFYEAVHMFNPNEIRNISKLYAHLLITESIDWSCLRCLKLRENATTSAGRCFIKFLFQELVSTLSMNRLIEYMQEPTKEEGFRDLFPMDEEQDIRFAINFFTCSGMAQLTDGLRKELLSRQE